LTGGSRRHFPSRRHLRALVGQDRRLRSRRRRGSLPDRFPSSELTIDPIWKALGTCANPSRLSKVSATPTVNDEWCRNARYFHAGSGSRLLFCRPAGTTGTRRLRAEPRERRCSSRPALLMERKGVATTKKTGRDPSAPREDVPTSRSGQPFRHRVASRMQETACPHQRIHLEPTGFSTLQGGSRCASTP